MNRVVDCSEHGVRFARTANCQLDRSLSTFSWFELVVFVFSVLFLLLRHAVKSF